MKVTKNSTYDPNAKPRVRRSGTTKHKFKISFADALVGAWAARRREVLRNGPGWDSKGHCTTIGKPRHLWLGGISAQRGF